MYRCIPEILQKCDVFTCIAAKNTVNVKELRLSIQYKGLMNENAGADTIQYLKTIIVLPINYHL